MRRVKSYTEFPIIKLCFIILIFYLETSTFGQNHNNIDDSEIEINELNYIRKIASYQFSPDSLMGFDEKKALEEITKETSDPLVQKYLMYLKKREYIERIYYYPTYFTNNKFSNNEIYSAACNNEDFETGDFTGWIVNTGVVSDACSGAGCCPNGFGLANVLTTPFTDGYVGPIGASPFGGTKVALLNDAAVGARAVRIRKNITVNPNNALFQFAYIAVLNVPSNSHPCCAVPKIKIRIIDPSGNIVGCPQVEVSVPQGGCPPLPAGWVSSGSVVYNPTWQIGSIDLTSFMGQNIGIIVDVYDCTWTGHFGYAYFDAICKPITIDVNGIQFPAGNNNINVTACGASTATLTAPAGLAPYTWNGPSGSGIVNNPNQQITTTTPGVYTLVMNPPGICNPIVKTMTLNFSPPITLAVSSSSNTICSGQSATLSVTPSMGGGTFTWSPGGSNSSSIVVSPPTTQVYAINYTAPNGCPASSQFTVTVNPTPTISLPSFTMCNTNTAVIHSTVNPSGGTYTWSPTGANTPSILINPSTGINSFTLSYSSGAGCVNTSITNITVHPTPTLSINHPTICYMSSAILNPTILPSPSGTYTWLPSGQNTTTIAISPPSNTSYTLLFTNSNGCSNSIVSNVTVVPAPTITIAGNYTYCESPNNSLILTPTVNPGGGTFVWYPNGISSPTIAISPTATSVYTVQYTDINTGCKSETSTTVVIRPGFKMVNFTIHPPVVCSDASTMIVSSTVIPSFGSYSLLWDFGTNANPSSSSSSSVLVTYNNSVGYIPIKFYVTNNYSGCTDSLIKYIQIEPTPNLDFIYNVKNCQSNNINFTNLSWVGGMSNIVNFYWDFGDGNHSFQTSPTHSYSSAGNYTVTLIATTDYGCNDTVQKIIQVFDVVTAGNIVNSQTVCASNNSGTLQVIGNNGQIDHWEYSDDFMVNWHIINTSSSVLTYSNLNVTRIYRALIKNGDCPEMYTTPYATITINSVSKAGTLLRDTVLCLGNNHVILELKNYVGDSIQWYYSYNLINWDTIPFSSNHNNVSLNNISDTMWVKVLVKNGVCNFDTSNIIKLLIRKFETTPFNSIYDYTISLGDTLQLGVVDGNYFNWSPLYNILWTNSNPNFVYPYKDTIYNVYVTDQYGCQDTVSFRVFVNKDYKLIIANTITPNNDGKNDIWWVGNIENYINNEVFIFNRYGQEIFNGKNYDNKKVYWDGTFQGVKVPDGTYYFVIKFNTNNEPIIFKGHINVISSN